MRTAVAVLALVLGACCGAAVAAGQEPDAEAVRKERLQEMRRRATSLLVEYGEAATPCPPAGEPLLRFGDATRAFHDGTLWAWTVSGRPFLLASIERYEAVWSYELISLTDSPFSLEDGTGWSWRPAQSPFAAQPIPDARLPAETSANRQRQARELSRRFSAVEYAGDQNRVELRLQPRPIHEYRAPEQGLLEGAMFVFSNGTNPEVLLLLEAVENDSGASEWRYVLARVSTAAMEASLDGQQVWRVEHSTLPRDQGPYSYFAVPLNDP